MNRTGTWRDCVRKGATEKSFRLRVPTGFFDSIGHGPKPKGFGLTTRGREKAEPHQWMKRDLLPSAAFLQ